MSSDEDYKLDKQKKDIKTMIKLKEDGITDIKDVDKNILKNTFNISDDKTKNIESKSTSGITKKSAFQISQEAADKGMKYLEDNVGITSIFLVMEKNKWRLIILFIIFIYIIFVNVLMVYNPGEYISYLKSLLIPFFVLWGFVLFTALLFSGKSKDVNNEQLVGYSYIETETKKLLKHIGLLFGFSLMFMTILYTSTQILYQINVNFNGLTMLAFIVDIFLIIFAIGLLYTLGVFKKPSKEDEDGDKKKNIKNKKLYDLFYNLVLYIPCMIIDSMEFLGEQYKSSKSKVVIVLVIEIVLIMMHFIIPELIKASLQQEGTVLLNEPEYLSNENIIAYHGDLFEPAEYTSFDDENVKFFKKLNLGFRKMVGFKEGFDELTGNQYMRDLILEIGNDNELMKKLERVRKDEEARKRLSQILPNKELVVEFLEDYDGMNSYSFFDFFKELKSRAYLYYNSIFGDITIFDEATKDLSEYQNSVIDRVDLTTKPYVKDYNYALSFWFYIDSTIDNGNDAYNKDINIFSYGENQRLHIMVRKEN